MDISHLYTFCILKWTPIDYFFGSLNNVYYLFIPSKLIDNKSLYCFMRVNPALHCKYKIAVHAYRSDKNDKKIQYELYTDMQLEFDRVRRLHMEETQFD